jgi:Rieske Fe-S protein
MLGVAGLAAASVPLLASCGGEDLPEVGEGKTIVEEGELEPTFAFADAESGEPHVLVRLKSGEYALYSAKCTHQGCTVSYEPEGQYLGCPCHGSTYDAKDGSVFYGPAKKPLTKLGVKVENGSVVTA